MPDTIVPVSLPGRSYDIVIGADLIDTAGNRLAELFSGRRIGLVTDAVVADLHLDRLISSLERARFSPVVYTLPAGEASKSFDNFRDILNTFLEAGFDRNDALVAFGGGVVGDITGFAASALKRGCRFVQIPTTLLAQVDSSVGGKTAINAPQGKNLIGAFYQPALVLSDTEVLNTLPHRQLLAGYAEVVKYGLLGDADFFDWLQMNGADVLSGKGPARREAIARSCRAKAAIVAEDERERGNRALLNLGHTFGHALESVNNYQPSLLHGEGVSAGMALAFDLSARLGLCADSDANACAAHLKAAGLPASLSDMPQGLPLEPEALLAAMAQDKKNSGDQITLILARAIGEAFITREISKDTLLTFLKDKAREAAS